MSRLAISELSPDNIHESLFIRDKVFIQEQAVPYDLEIDGLDDTATHFLGRLDGKAVATARARFIQPGLAKIERVSVLEEYRGAGHGRLIMQHIIESMDSKGVAKLTLESQTQAQKFYESLGFLAVGEEFMDAGIPHVKMIQVLDQEKAAELESDKRSYALSEQDNRALKATFEEAATLLVSLPRLSLDEVQLLRVFLLPPRLCAAGQAQYSPRLALKDLVLAQNLALIFHPPVRCVQGLHSEDSDLLCSPGSSIVGGEQLLAQLL